MCGAPTTLYGIRLNESAIPPSEQVSLNPVITFTWPDPDGRRPSTVLVASFDNHLHHRMTARVGTHDLIVTLRVPPGRHTYKFLVDGRWMTHPALHPKHPILVSDDGVKHHLLIVNPPSGSPSSANNPAISSNPLSANAPASVSVAHEPRPAVFRSASATSVPALMAATAAASSSEPMSGAASNSSGATGLTIDASRIPANVSMTTSAPHLVAPRGSSFNMAPPTVASLSTQALARMPVEQRRSLLHRVGSGWRKRFSSRPDGPFSSGIAASAAGNLATHNYFQYHHPQQHLPQVVHPPPSPSLSLSRSHFPSPDRSASALFRTSRDSVQSAAMSRQNANPALFPSSSEPVVARSAYGGFDDKENCSFGMNSSTRSGPATTPDRRRGPLRGSSRATAVKVSVSGPTRVDEPRDLEEVTKQADNWRKMAKHLQDNLHDAAAARVLLQKAIVHREKHGLECCAANAQLHTDLARNLSKAEKIADAEAHLRTALEIYNTLGMGSEHIADLQLYVGVMVDRQKRREEAELLYRQALEMYCKNEVKSNNMNIAIKNLVLNLKKQNRGHDIVEVYTRYGRCDE